jgi:hypothetical protein
LGEKAKGQAEDPALEPVTNTGLSSNLRKREKRGVLDFLIWAPQKPIFFLFPLTLNTPYYINPIYFIGLIYFKDLVRGM